MSLSNNPLKQYFRRPAIYLKLPSGGQGYQPGIINMPESGELPVYPMTAIDEITTRTPDALYNGTAIIELIKSCIPDIIDPWKIFSTDLDAILIAIKSASQGNELEIETECPKCNEVSTYGVNLVGVLSSLKASNYNNELEIGDLSIKFKPLVYTEMNEASLSQFEVQKMFANIETIETEEERIKISQKAIKTITEVTMKILSKTMEHVRTPGSIVTQPEFILDFLQNCDKNTYIAIRDFHTELKNSSEIKPLNIKCVSCGHDYKQSFVVNASNFFD
jgi:hypothetical protein